MDPDRLGESMDGETVNWMKSIAKKEKIILVGSAMIKEDHKNYNRLYGYYPQERFSITINVIVFIGW